MKPLVFSLLAGMVLGAICTVVFYRIQQQRADDAALAAAAKQFTRDWVATNPMRRFRPTLPVSALSARGYLSDAIAGRYGDAQISWGASQEGSSNLVCGSVLVRHRIVQWVDTNLPAVIWIQ